jgi:tetratricopeptide (TPR) repeat protein
VRPQLSDEEFKENFLISHGSDLATIGTDSTTFNVELNQFLTLDNLKSDFKGQYELGLFVARNKNHLLLSDFQKMLDKLMNELESDLILDNNQLEKLWNQLIYSSFKKGNASVRDMIISIFVANHMILKLDSIKQLFAETDDISKYARSIVVLPKEFKRQTTIPAKSSKAATSLPISKSLQSEINYRAYDALLKDLTAADKFIKRAQANSKASFDLDYSKALNTAYEKATLIERVITDPETEETQVVEEYKGLELPELTYEPINTLDKNFLTKFVSNDTNGFIQTIIETKPFQNINDLIDYATTIRNEQRDEYFADINENDRVYLIDGHVIDTVDPSDHNPNRAFICFNPIRGADRFSVTFRGGTVPIMTALRATYHLTGENITNNTSGAVRPTNNPQVFEVMLYNEMGVPNGNYDNFKGQLELADGRILAWDFPFDGNRVSSGESFCVPFDLTAQNTDDGNSNNNTVDPIIDPSIPSGYGIQRLGIADYRKVEQEICCYVPGEVSHIENVMAREFKQKMTRRLRRNEESTSTTRESEKEALTESTSTDRFEMNQEIASLTARDQTFAASAGMSTEFKNVNISANANYATSTAQENSNSQAVTHAKDVTERALQSIVEKITEERVVKIVEEFEETTDHGYDNRKGDDHISGVYRWVDKIYKNQILNYGKRLMYEFMIPEPASFHKYAAMLASREGKAIEITKPVDPRKSGSHQILSASSMNESQAMYWAAYYNAEIKALPENNVIVTEAFESTDLNFIGKDEGKIQTVTGKGEIIIPDGYMGVDGSFDIHSYGQQFKGTKHLTLSIGSKSFVFDHQHISAYSSIGIAKEEGVFSSIDNAYGTVKYAYLAAEAPVVSGSIKINCALSTSTIQQWKLETFNAILKAYENAKKVYEDTLKELDNKNTETIKLNPGFYREIEKSILRKNCLSYLLEDGAIGRDMLLHRNSNNLKVDVSQQLDRYASQIQFFEQAFEWNIMSYQFYPFYWAEKSTWTNHYQQDNNDPLFRAFLQSGMARVIVTVTPGYEEAVNFYMATGQIWNSGQVPTIDDPEFQSIIDDLRITESVVEETWESRVPTSLTVIQAGSIGLNVEGLPCNPDCDDKLFESDNNPIEQSNALIGENKDRYVQFIYKGFETGLGGENISEWDNNNLFPLKYAINDQEVIIDRDASWSASSDITPIMQKLVSELSFLPGVKARLLTPITNGNPDHILISYDTTRYPLFIFDKSLNANDFNESFDRLRVKASTSTVLFELYTYANERLAKVGGAPIVSDTEYDINEFIV